MLTVVCTLFENHYHYGVAALTNSLYRCGYKGAIYVGYRGVLPQWILNASDNKELLWSGATTLNIADSIQLHFLPLETDYHLTNYKPDFMLRLWSGPAKNAEAMFYFDPDIVLTAQWHIYEDWIRCGIALCEDVNSPLANYHPMRVAWRKHFKTENINLKFKDSYYANGGFIGIHAQNVSFLQTWQQIQVKMAMLIGGLSKSAFTSGEKPHPLMEGPFSPFNKTDQDALNATVEAWDGKVSFIGKNAMGFESGAALMLHALDQPKPWMANILKQLIGAKPPRSAHQEFWKASLYPLRVKPIFLIKGRIFMLKVTSFIGRFYRRN